MGEFCGPGEVLLDRLNKIEVEEGQERALIELAYTASESGFLPFSVGDDCSKLLIQLVGLASQYRKGVPDEVRM